MKIKIILGILFVFTIIIYPKDPVVMVHGYNKNKKDMISLKKYLGNLGYNTHLVNLPLTHKHINKATKMFKKQLQQISKQYSKNTKFHIVGHSTGGLVILNYLRHPVKEISIDRCVQIATPNKGSQLADIAFNYLPFIFKNYKTLNDIQTEKTNIPKNSLINNKIGAIAGNKSNSIYSIIIKGDDDGRISIDSVKIPALEDFLILPYGHKEIHHKKKTAKYIHNFLEYGKFEPKKRLKTKDIIN